MTKHTLITFFLVGTLSLVIGGWLGSQFRDSAIKVPQDLEASLFPEGRDLPELTLIDQDAKPFGNQRLKGKWSFMFFGFTRCPDICPDTLSVMQEVWETIGKDYPLQMLFITVDPMQDTPKAMKEYVKYFHKDFIGITGELANIDKLTRSLGILYGYEPTGKDKNSYGVNHSAQILLIAPDAKLRAVFSPPHEVDEITETFRKIEKLVGG